MPQPADGQLSMLGGLGPPWEKIEIQDAEVFLCRTFLAGAEAEEFFRSLLVPWIFDYSKNPAHWP